MWGGIAKNRNNEQAARRPPDSRRRGSLSTPLTAPREGDMLAARPERERLMQFDQFKKSACCRARQSGAATHAFISKTRDTARAAHTFQFSLGDLR